MLMLPQVVKIQDSCKEAMQKRHKFVLAPHPPIHPEGLELVVKLSPKKIEMFIYAQLRTLSFYAFSNTRLFNFQS